MNFTAYEENPGDWSARIAIINDMVASNFREMALMAIEHALHDDPPREIRVQLLEQASICGFYSKLPSRKELGKAACESIALDRTLSWQTRNLARQNSTYYARGSVDVFPETRFSQVGFLPPDDYKPMNPSIALCNGELCMIQRTVNYVIRPDGSYDMRGDSAIRTRNFLIRLDADLNVILAEEILPPEGLPPPEYGLVIGWEDCRLFWWQNDFWCTSTVRELNAEGYCEIVLSRIAKDSQNNYRFTDFRKIIPNFTSRQHEKNWMPMVINDSLYFVYSSDPARIINEHGALVSQKISHAAVDSFRGGGPVIEFNGGWLACIHESHIMPDNRRRYMHRFAWYDGMGRLLAISEAFYIKQLGIEFAAGLARNPITGDIIVSFGFADKESWFAIFKEKHIKHAMKPAGDAASHLGNTTDMLLLLGQTNTALSGHSMVKTVIDIANRANLPLHVDPPKNWDNCIAILNCSLTTDPGLAVMDVAATKESAFLPGLKKLGYQKLISINIDEPNPGIFNGIEYRAGDCTGTEFESGSFGFISCLSVIEHGVDLDRFFAESRRLLVDNGHLFISTDYWQDPIDTYNQTAFGSPVKVFTRQDMLDIVSLAESHGFVPVNNIPIDLHCHEKPVNWIGMDYTFVNLLFKKIT